MEDTSEFVADCIDCIMAKSGAKIPRPMSTTLHAKFSNEVIPINFLYMVRSTDDHRYLQVIKDDPSS